MPVPDQLTIATLVTAQSDVMHELLRQNEKWGRQDHDETVWALIAAEEIGEALSEVVPRVGELILRHVVLPQVASGAYAKALLDARPGLDHIEPHIPPAPTFGQTDVLLRRELVQAAAVLVQWIAAIDRRKPTSEAETADA